MYREFHVNANFTPTLYRRYHWVRRIAANPKGLEKYTSKWVIYSTKTEMNLILRIHYCNVHRVYSGMIFKLF